jgi:hypothetical protein
MQSMSESYSFQTIDCVERESYVLKKLQRSKQSELQKLNHICRFSNEREGVKMRKKEGMR